MTMSLFDLRLMSFLPITLNLCTIPLPYYMEVTHHAFPVEIWRSILRWATWVPFALNTDLPDYFTNPTPPSQDQIQKDLLHTLSTKNGLTRVCWYWNALATPFLYEVVLVRSHQAFTALCRTIEASATASNTGYSHRPTEHIPLGHWVKRVDIMFSEVVPKELDWPSDLLYNLEIFVLRGKGLLSAGHATQYSPVTLPSSSKSRNLKVIDISQTLYLGRVDMLHDMIGNNPGLRQLHGRTFEPIIEGYSLNDNSAKLPIQLWDMDSYVDNRGVDGKYISLYTSMHSLRHLICRSYVPASQMYPALSTTGPRLETLELDFSEVESHVTERVLLSDAARMCPSLRSVIINLSDFNILNPDRLTGFPSVTNIGLRFASNRHRCKRRQLNSLCRGLRDIVRQTGTIQVIRILDRRTADYLLRAHLPSLESLAADLSLDNRRVRLEDPNGESILRGVEFVPLLPSGVKCSKFSLRFSWSLLLTLSILSLHFVCLPCFVFLLLMGVVRDLSANLKLGP